jgi:nicotinate phosphoribosyltransferase
MYDPQENLLEGIRRAFPLQLFPWDDYFPRMAETDWFAGRGDTLAVKSYFIRKSPFEGSFALLGGITACLRGVADLSFEDDDFFKGMLDMGYRGDFVGWLNNCQRLRLKIYAPPEGEIFAANVPIITAIGPLPHIRLFEGILTEAVNFATLNLTKWHRLVRTVRPANVLEFARRRAQNATKATLYAMLAGCFATSNSEMRRFFNFKVIGTMGHEWVQGFGDVEEAFRIWLDHQPSKAIGLIDTKQCLEHDFPAWLKEVEQHQEAIKRANPPIWGWRNDSGDLAYLTIEQYIKFQQHPLAQDPWFAEKMRIVLTNELDEYAAKSITEQIYSQARAAGLDANDIIQRIIWAAGTKPGTCDDQPSLGGVAKLMEIKELACIKLAFDANGRPGIKTSIPGFNKSVIVRDSNGEVKCILVYPARRYEVKSNGRLQDLKESTELSVLTACHPDNPGARMEIYDYTATPQQQLVYDSIDGSGFTEAWDNPSISTVPIRIQKAVDNLHWSMTRLDKPYPIKVSLTPDLFELRQQMIQQGVLREDQLKKKGVF